MLESRAAIAPRNRSLTRRSFFIDRRVLRKARRLLGAASDAERVRISVERIAEMEAFWRLLLARAVRVSVLGL